MKRNPTSGCGENNKDKRDIPISPKLMGLSTKHTYTSKCPYQGVEKVSRAIRNKIP